jgi:hypothetical protein
VSTTYASTDDSAFEQYKKTCSIIFGKATESQLRYLQAHIELQQTLLTSCDSIVTNQLDWLKKYVKENRGSNFFMEPLLKMYTSMVDTYTSCISTAYDSGTLNIETYRRTLDILNKSFSTNQVNYEDLYLIFYS